MCPLVFLIKPPVANDGHSTVTALSNPKHFPKAPSLNIIVGLSCHPLNASQWEFNSTENFEGRKSYSNHSTYHVRYVLCE
jgi:hypothetical protein